MCDRSMTKLILRAHHKLSASAKITVYVTCRYPHESLEIAVVTTWTKTLTAVSIGAVE